MRWQSKWRGKDWTVGKKSRGVVIIEKKITFICFVLLLISFLFTVYTINANGMTAKKAAKNIDKINITFYYNNACASCDEVKVYEEVVKTGLDGLGDMYPYEIWILNTFQTVNREKLQKEILAHNWDEAKLTLPLMMIGEHAVSGVEAMKAQIGELFQLEAKTRLQQEKLIFFSTYACNDCERVSKFLTDYGFVSEEYNINEENNTELIYQYFKEFHVRTEDQQVPIVFQENRYLSGADEIIAGLIQESDNISKSDETELILEEELSPVLYLKDSGKVVLTGLVNGLNPCSASMLLFLLSLFVVSGISLIKVGFSYLAGRLFSYIAMGLGFYSLGSFVNERMISQIMAILQWGFFILAVLIATMNLLDFIHARRQEYGKIRLQLPKVLRHWNHERIKKIQNIPTRWLIPAVFLLGFVISAGEFFCTGQIYVAVIIYMIRIQTHFIQAVILLCIYVLAMCIPQAIIILLVNKSKNILKVSVLELKHMPLIKLLNTLIFFGFALWILLTM